MIKVDAKTRTVREAKAPFEYNEGGELKTEKIRVRYFSPTTLEHKAEQAEKVARMKEMSDISDAQRAAAKAIREWEEATEKAEAKPDDKTLKENARKMADKADELSVAAREKAKTAADNREQAWLSHQLAKRLESLPDLADAKGKAFEITIENLDALPFHNLQAIEKAIDDDLAPKEQPSK